MRSGLAKVARRTSLPMTDVRLDHELIARRLLGQQTAVVPQRIRIKYPGVCRVCGRALNEGAPALWSPGSPPWCVTCKEPPDLVRLHEKYRKQLEEEQAHRKQLEEEQARWARVPGK